MRSRTQTATRIPVTKLTDVFCKVIEVVLTEQALKDAPCHSLSRSQWEGLLFVERHQYCSIRDLAEGLGVSHPAAVKMVERLTRKGRALGEQCVEAVRGQRAQVLEQVLAEMDGEETESLLYGLQAFLRAALRDRDTAELVCLHCGREHVEECLVFQARGGRP